MKVLIRPKKVSGTIDVVPSKSYSHRAIIAASLANGVSKISNVIFSDDITRTINCCRAFGAEIECFENYLIVKGTKEVLRKESLVNAGESGSTVRFMIPIMLTNPLPMTFTGENHLNKRPLDTFYELFIQDGIEFSHPKDSYMPLNTDGGLKGGIYKLRGDISSQFITGLLFALPLLKTDSVIEITSKLESKSYIDLTLDILKLFNIDIINNDYKEFVIKGNQEYKACDYTVEGDFSQAAFFLVMGALGNDVKLRCMNLKSLQGDRKIIEDIKALGGEIVVEEDYIQAVSKNLKGAIIDFSQSPDLGPVLSVLASVCSGDSKFINASRLRIKECDRITCVKEELNKLGANVSESAEEMYFTGVSKLDGCDNLIAHNDHRIAMSLAVASTICDKPLIIENAECVKKSYPHFWQDFKKLGGDFDVFD